MNSNDNNQSDNSSNDSTKKHPNKKLKNGINNEKSKYQRIYRHQLNQKHSNDEDNNDNITEIPKTVRTYRVKLSPNDSTKLLQSLNSTPMCGMSGCNDEMNDFTSMINFLSGLERGHKKDNINTNKQQETPIVHKFEIKDNINYDNLIEKYDSLEKLIKLGKAYSPEFKYKYAFDYEKLYKIVKPLEELQNVIGMESVKTSIVNQIMYFLLELEPVSDMLHTVIQGPPGVGKTLLGQILANIYQKMGVIEGCDSNNPVKFKIYKRSDFIGQYLGHTAIKTQKAIDECLGGVMFIDEAYSLGSSTNAEKSDIYSKECLDTIMQNLSEKAGQFVVIIAGYADELDRNFFASNEGLRRRFTFKYTIDKYDEMELARILHKKASDSKWLFNSNLDIDKLAKFIGSKYGDFPHFAGDIETFLFHVKVCHATRIFGLGPQIRKIIDNDDIQNGFKRYKMAREETKHKIPASALMMYN